MLFGPLPLFVFTFSIISDPPLDCSLTGTCFKDITTALASCSLTSPVNVMSCINEVIGKSDPCTDCVCDLIPGIGKTAGLDLSCAGM